MKLADLRRAAVRNNARIRFRSPHGVECVVTERGLAQVPGLRGVPAFNLEQELESAGEFTMESKGATTSVSREQVERWATPSTSTAHDDAHDE
jgi:hypothetical protein